MFKRREHRIIDSFIALLYEDDVGIATITDKSRGETPKASSCELNYIYLLVLFIRFRILQLHYLFRVHFQLIQYRLVAI